MTLKSFTEILSDMLTAVAEKTRITNFNIGSVIRSLLEVVTGAISELYNFIGIVHSGAFLATATGKWLDYKAKEFGLTRKEAIFTEGNVIFGRDSAESKNRTIPAGTIVATLPDQTGMAYRYITQIEVILLAYELEISALVKAEFVGAAYNVGADAIKVLTVYIPGITYVRNEATWITVEGIDEETDEELRTRTYLAWEELAQGGTKAAYISWALSVSGVKNVYVNDNFPRGQGTVDIFILSVSGIPSPALIAEVQTVIDNNKPICSDALVLAPVVYDVTINILVTPRKFSNTTVMEGEIRTRMDAYFNPSGDPNYTWIEPLGIGRDVIFNQLVEIVMSVPGVYDVDFIAPTEDIEIAPDEFPSIISFVINFGAEAEY